jgi:hypothetical protein
MKSRQVEGEDQAAVEELELLASLVEEEPLVVVVVEQGPAVVVERRVDQMAYYQLND